MYSYIHGAAAAAAALCCYTAVVAEQLLLLVIVCRMAKNVAGLLNLIPSSVFFLFKHGLYNVRTPVLSLLPPRFAYTATSSVITGMRGAKAGVSPPRRIPTCTNTTIPRGSYDSF